MEKSSSPRRLLQKEKFLRYHQKSLTHLGEGNLDKAQKILEGLSINPDYELLCLNNLSITYMKQRIYNKAMITLLKAYAKSKLGNNIKEHLGTLINLTVAASNLSIHEEALNYALQAKTYLKDDGQEVAPIVYYNLGIEYIYLKKFREAEESLSKALSCMHESNTDQNFKPIIIAALSWSASHKTQTPDSKISKPQETSRKKSLKKVSSAGNILKSPTKVLEKYQILEKPRKKILKTEKTSRVTKRSESQVSSRANLISQKTIERQNGSSTSSTESIKNNSCIGSKKSLRKIILSEKSSKQSTPLSKANKLLISTDHKLGNRLQNIGDHLTLLEKNLMNFTEMCKPLKILTEDPDEQIDSNRAKIEEFTNEKSNSTQGVRSAHLLQDLAALKIQRAFKKYKSNKVTKTLLKFKDNPLFKPTLLTPKIKKSH